MGWTRSIVAFFFAGVVLARASSVTCADWKSGSISPPILASAPRALASTPQSLWGDPGEALVRPTFSVAGVASLE
jgi:hypothetical protein